MRQSRSGWVLPLFLSFLLLVGVAFGAGWGAHWLLGRMNVPLPLPSLTLPGGYRLQPAPQAATAAAAEESDLSLFWEAMALLDENFYAQEELPRDEALPYAAIEGVIDATGDPHSSFLDPASASEFQQDLEGEFEGIGARVDMSEAGLVIVSPFPGTPAAEAGLRPGDVVVEIDGQPTQGMDLEEAVSLVRGQQGTVVNLTVRREGTPDLLVFDITRANVVVPIVETRMIEEAGLPPIGYLRLTDFGRNSAAQVERGLEELMEQGAERLILDLRYNPGGLLDAAVSISSEFIGEGMILTERTSTDREIRHPAQAGGVALEIPLVLLVNEGSASASEILAGAIKDTGRGTLIGTTTFGKGSVQRLHILSDDSLLRLTVARWFTPAGNAIHEVGIEPDIVIEATPEQVGSEEDPQLDAAIDFFRNQ